VKRHLTRALAVLGAVVLLGAHIVLLHHFSSRLAWPLLVTVPLVGLVVARHTGLFAALHDRLRPRS
jgi:hypothetical protein